MARQIQIIGLFFFLFLISINLASSEAFAFNQSSKLCRPVRVDSGIGTGVSCNITIEYPNSSTFVDFLSMDDEGDRFCYNLTGADNSIKGIYDFEITCQNGQLNDTLTGEYIVNLGGVEPSQQRTDAISRTIYFIFGIGILLFIGFFITEQTPVKWTFFLLSLLFFLIAINFLFLSLQDEIVNPRMEGFFSSFTAISFILYRFIVILIAVIWLLTVFVTIFEKMRNSKARRLSAYG